MVLHLKGEVIGIRTSEKGTVYRVLHSFNGGKEIAEVFYGRTDKEGKEKAIPEYKAGQPYSGLVVFKDFCFPTKG